MIELIVVFAIVAVLCGTLLAPLPWVLAAAATCLGLGFAVGVPTGLWYHVALRRELLEGELPDRWWLRPTALHDRLGDESRARVMPWFFAGGLGFAFTVAGCLVLAAAALRLLLGGA